MIFGLQNLHFDVEVPKRTSKKAKIEPPRRSSRDSVQKSTQNTIEQQRLRAQKLAELRAKKYRKDHPEVVNTSAGPSQSEQRTSEKIG